MLNNIDIIGKFYLGNGGIGDFLLFMSTFYDDIEESNIIFLANDEVVIKELVSIFPKLNKKLILKNDFKLLLELVKHKNCIGTGILPVNLNRELDYSLWYKVNIFETYKVKEFPDFMNLFQSNRICNKQIFIQSKGSVVDGSLKRRIILNKTLDEHLFKYVKDGYLIINNEDKKRTIFETLSIIKGSDLVFSVDSFAKTFSAMNKIKTIVFDNIYDDSYLNKFKDNIDYGHYVFIKNWKYINLIKQ